MGEMYPPDAAAYASDRAERATDTAQRALRIAEGNRRERIATALLAGILASPNKIVMHGLAAKENGDQTENHVTAALHLADALIAKLDR